MTVLIAFLVALVVGLLVWFVARLVPFTTRYAEPIGLLAFIITLLVRLGA